MRFGGTEGMIIQLNNDEGDSRFERHFDCGWLSAFPEESECLWMGGRCLVKLESVRVIETKNNYCRFLRAFHLFDSMLSSDPQFATKRDARIVRGAMLEYLGSESNGYHSFVNDTFRHFCVRKTKIELHLVDMKRYLKNEDLVSLVMNELKTQSEYSDVSDDNVNLPKPVVFELFGNLQELVIQAVTYAFNLERLSQFAFPKALQSIIIRGYWLEDAFTDTVKQRFKKQGWDMELEEDESMKEDIEDDDSDEAAQDDDSDDWGKIDDTLFKMRI